VFPFCGQASLLRAVSSPHLLYLAAQGFLGAQGFFTAQGFFAPAAGLEAAALYFFCTSPA